jgi:hypothetical protein
MANEEENDRSEIIWQGSDQNESGFWQWRGGGNEIKWRQSALKIMA